MLQICSARLQCMSLYLLCMFTAYIKYVYICIYTYIYICMNIFILVFLDSFVSVLGLSCADFVTGSPSTTRRLQFANNGMNI